MRRGRCPRRRRGLLNAVSAATRGFRWRRTRAAPRRCAGSLGRGRRWGTPDRDRQPRARCAPGALAAQARERDAWRRDATADDAAAEPADVTDDDSRRHRRRRGHRVGARGRRRRRRAGRRARVRIRRSGVAPAPGGPGARGRCLRAASDPARPTLAAPLAGTPAGPVEGPADCEAGEDQHASTTPEPFPISQRHEAGAPAAPRPPARTLRSRPGGAGPRSRPHRCSPTRTGTGRSSRRRRAQGWRQRRLRPDLRRPQERQRSVGRGR